MKKTEGVSLDLFLLVMESAKLANFVEYYLKSSHTQLSLKVDILRFVI